MNPKLIAYKAEHCIDMDDDVKRAILRERLSVVAYSAVDDNGRVLGYAGLGHLYGSNYALWALFSDELKASKFWLHRTAKKYLRAILATIPYQRVECIVAMENYAACRWIEALGLRAESANGVPVLARKAGPNGENCLRFELVR